jgi:hypothetical protein
LAQRPPGARRALAWGDGPCHTARGAGGRLSCVLFRQPLRSARLEERFPQSFLDGVVPPSNTVLDKIRTSADAHFERSLADMEKCLFDKLLIWTSGKTVPRPAACDPPKGRVRPI